MKKTSFFLALLILMASASVVVAADNGQKNQNQNQIQVEVRQDCIGGEDDNNCAGNNDESALIMAQEQEREREMINNRPGGVISSVSSSDATTTPPMRARNIQELQQIIQAAREEFKQELDTLKDERKKEILEKQNAVREAVKTLLASEDLIGGIGQQVSAIAQEFNNSVDKTIANEEQIQNRNRIIRFFFGGDKAAARDLQEEVNANNNKLEELKALYDGCGCDESLKNLIREQIQNIEQEQERLQQVVDDQSVKGVWGWIKGLFGR